MALTQREREEQRGLLERLRYDAQTLAAEFRLPLRALEAELRDCGVRAFRAIDACGYARVDFFVERSTTRVLVNEINTIPGFTSISMFPKLWEASGLPYGDLVSRLVELGLARHARRARLRTDYR